MKTTNYTTVRSLERGLKILECFKANTSLTLTEVSDIVSLSVTTCDRLLKTLVDMGFLEKNSNKKYVLGNRMFEFLNVLSHRSNLTEVAHPSLMLLRDTYNETASLYIQQNVNRVSISSVESTYALRRTVPIGEVLPLTQGAVGEVFLSHLPIKEIEGLFGELDMDTRKRLEKVQRNGYAENDSVQEEGVYAIAAPIFDVDDSIVGVISVSGPSYRIREKRESIIKAIVFHSNSISVKLGYKI